MKSKNLPLIIAILLPFLFIIIISLVVFTPNLSVKPAHNFLYTVKEDYYSVSYKNSFTVDNGRITLGAAFNPYTQAEIQKFKGDMPPLFLYDVQANTSRQITFDEAKTYMLDVGPSSPDGYTVSYQYGHNGLFELFGSNSGNSGFFIMKGSGRKKLTGLAFDSYSYGADKVKIVGWIK